MTEDEKIITINYLENVKKYNLRYKKSENTEKINRIIDAEIEKIRAGKV